MTIREGFEKARDYYASIGDTEMVEFFETRLAQNAKKSNGERKPTANQIQNAGFKEDILAWMEDNVVYSSMDVFKGVPSLVAAGCTANRVSALLGQLFKENKLSREEVKGRFMYHKA